MNEFYTNQHTEQLDWKSGKQGEAITYNYLTSKGWQVQDLTNVKEYFGKDVDFIAIKDGQELKIETKLNRVGRATTVYIEDMLNIYKGRAGWLHYTEADFIFIVKPSYKRIYVFKTDEMRHYIDRVKVEKANLDITKEDWFKNPYLAEERYTEDWAWEKRFYEPSVSKCYLVDMEKYEALGYGVQKIDLN